MSLASAGASCYTHISPMGRKIKGINGRFVSSGGQGTKQRLIKKAPSGERRSALLEQESLAKVAVATKLQIEKVARLTKLLKRKNAPGADDTIAKASAAASEGRHDEAVELLQAALK